MTSQNAPALPPQAVLQQMINGYWITGSIHAAARLGIADKVADTARPITELAADLEANPDALFRLMRALASVGIFVEGPARSFAHTPLSQALRVGVPGSMHGLAHMTGLMHMRAWPDIAHSVRTGAPAFDHVFGKPIFEYVKEDAEAGAAFDEAMAGYTAATSGAVVAAFDFSPYKTIVDVGGGNGALLAAVLQKVPTSVGVCFDMPTSAPRAKALLEARGLVNRCEVVGGDFFASVPAGGDAYTLKAILHDWDDARAIAILQKVRAAMSTGARVLVIETVIDPATGAGAPGKLIDINMLVMTGGRERTAEEYALLFKESGLELVRTTPLPAGGLAVLEARPV